MLVVADSSPINILVRIDCVRILPELFGTVVVPPQVIDELSESRTPKQVQMFIATPPTWFKVQAPQFIERIAPLDGGEEAAISLARELVADALLIDERDGRRAASERGLLVVGTIGVLEEAAGRKLVDLRAALDRLQATDFRVSQQILDDAVARWERKRGESERT